MRHNCWVCCCWDHLAPSHTGRHDNVSRAYFRWSQLIYRNRSFSFLKDCTFVVRSSENWLVQSRNAQLSVTSQLAVAASICAKFCFGCGSAPHPGCWVAYSACQNPYVNLSVPTSKGKKGEKDGAGRNGRGREWEDKRRGGNPPPILRKLTTDCWMHANRRR